MTRQTYIPILSLWLLLLMTATGCTERDTADIITEPAAQEGDAYVRLRIAIPHADGEAASASTRAEGEDHGIANEYGVHSGFIVLFGGNLGADDAAFNEDALVYLTHYDMLTNSDNRIINEDYSLSTLFHSDESEHITSSGYITVQLDAKGKGAPHIFAMILLNCSTFAPVDGETFANFKKRPVQPGSVADGYFMSNVAMATKSGKSSEVDTAKIVTIPEVTKIFRATEDDVATSDDGTTVFVERAAAKVTVRKATDETQIIIDGNEKNTAIIHNMEWIVDNYNTESYLVRNFDPSWRSLSNGTYCPMIDDVEVKDNYGITIKEDRFRTLWGADQNYDSGTDLHTGDFTSEPLEPLEPLYKSGESAVIAENTQTDNQREHATRVVVRLILKDSSKLLLKSPCYGVNYGGKGYLFTSTAKYDAWKASHGDAPAYTVYSDTDGNGHPYVYYEAFVKHLDTNSVTTSGSEGLGKYGVVRNNAYTVTIGTENPVTPTPLATLGANAFPPLGTGSIE